MKKQEFVKTSYNASKNCKDLSDYMVDGGDKDGEPKKGESVPV